MSVTTKLQWRDLVGAGLVAAIIAPYAGYLVWGEAPLVPDARVMALVGLGLGFVAHSMVARGDHLEGAGLRAAWAAVASLLVGFTAFLFADFAAAEVLLALFMLSIVVALALELDLHSGGLIGRLLPHRSHR